MSFIISITAEITRNNLPRAAIRMPPSQATGLNKGFDFSLFHLNINFVHHSWEGDALPDVFFAGKPSDSFYPDRPYNSSSATLLC